MGGERTHACWVTVVLVCSVAFFINCQPSEPFLSKYLQEDKNITETQLDELVWPIDTYATLGVILPIAFLSEQVGYGGVVLVSLLCREATRVILIYSQGVTWMAITQGTYAIATVGNSVLLSYAYKQLPASWYMVASLLFYASYYLGNVIGSATGQLLVEHASFPLHRLFYLSWGFTSTGLIFFLFSLSRWYGIGRKRKLLSREDESEGNIVLEDEDESEMAIMKEKQNGVASKGKHKGFVTELLKMTWKERVAQLTGLYAPRQVVLWSLWWVFSYGANIIFGNYFQTFIYNEYDGENKKIQFGWIECGIEVASVFGNVVQLGKASSYASLPFTPLIMSLLLLVPAILIQFRFGGADGTIAPAVTILCAIKCVYSGSMSLATASIGKAIVGGRFVLVFLLNSFVSLALVSIVSAVASSLHANTSTFITIMAGFTGGAVLVLIPCTLWFGTTEKKSPVPHQYVVAYSEEELNSTHQRESHVDNDDYDDNLCAMDGDTTPLLI
eukprot:m.20467 g.20467  ORF g.20467 m.20467 type:complete len:501 (-) comp5253_c0_seq1:242-1744(-)